MPSVEERVAFLEGRVNEHAQHFTGIREAIAGLDNRITALEARMDRRFDAIDRRFNAIDRRFDAIDRRFTWVIGTQVSTLIAIVAALLVR